LRLRPGKKMIKWFFFNRIDMVSYGFSIHLRIKNTLDILPYPAKTKFTFLNFTAMRTKLAMYR